MSGSPRKIGDIPTPALVIDVDRVNGNIKRYHQIATHEGVRMRPHGKTSKLPFIWDMQRKAGAEGLTVATLREAEVARFHDHKDLLIAYPHVDPTALERIRDLMRAETRIALLVASSAGAEIVKGFFGDESPDVMLAIDTGLHREGVRSHGEPTLKLLEELKDLFGDKFHGISTHEGQGYRAHQQKTLISTAMGARDQMIALAKECKKRGITLKEVALGSTPTFAHFNNDRKKTITEAHPGNYALMDNTQVNLGVAQPTDCALTAIATVIGTRVIRQREGGKRASQGRVFINAGAKLLSEAKSPHSEGGVAYGRFYSDHGATAFTDHEGQIIRLSEEIGWARVQPNEVEGENPFYKIGETVRVLVQHACPAIAANTMVYIVEGEKVLGHLPIVARGHEPYLQFRRLLKNRK